MCWSLPIVKKHMLLSQTCEGPNATSVGARTAPVAHSPRQLGHLVIGTDPPDPSPEVQPVIITTLPGETALRYVGSASLE